MESGKADAAKLIEQPQNPAVNGQPGRKLFRFGGSLRWYLLGLTLFALASLGIAIYILGCAAPSSTVRVLPTGWNLAVDPFYSGLALSFILTPVAIVIRKISYELAMLQPFAVTSSRKTAMGDLDVLMDPGIWATLHLFKYNTLTASVQAFLLAAGAVLVPVGTLLVYTGTYVAPLQGTGMVGIPTDSDNVMTLSDDMVMAGYEYADGGLVYDPDNKDVFLNLGISSFLGALIQQSGILGNQSAQLGPESNTNLTYEKNIRYQGVPIYGWTSGCKYAPEIGFAKCTGDLCDDSIFNVTFPGRPHASTLLGGRYVSASARNVTNEDDPTSITTYYAITGPKNSTVNFDEALEASAITVVDDDWYTGVACTPTFIYSISSCVWRNGRMADCYAAPSTNTTALDDLGLEALVMYLSAVPVIVSNPYEYDPPRIFRLYPSIFGLDPLSTALLFDHYESHESGNTYRVPFLPDFDNMYGTVARSLATISTSGYYGVMQVPTTESTPQPAYLVRTWVLAVVVALLILSPLLTSIVLLKYVFRDIPLRRATFLTIANAVRGSRWDELLSGGCVMSETELRREHRGIKVMYGVDDDFPNHVGFAEVVSSVRKDELYAGVWKGER